MAADSQDTPEDNEVTPGLTIGGHVLPLPSDAASQVVSDAVFGGTTLPPAAPTRAGRLYLAPDVVLGANAPVVAVMGAFDGLHRGHRALVDAALDDADELQAPCVAVTFDPDPSEVVVGARPQPRLLSCADRVRGLLSLGVDGVLVMPFTHSLASTEPAGFVRRVLSSVGIVSLHVGENFHFGRNGAGDVGTLAALGAAEDFVVTGHPLVSEGGLPVSATRARGLLAQGDLRDVEELLGRCHFVRGTVIHGRGEGTGFGFPTANVQCDGLTCMPAVGVYAGFVVDGGRAWPAAINVGAPRSFTSRRDPTFLEANLIGYQGDLYGREVSVVFCAWLRGARKFSSLEELERVVRANIGWVQANLGSECVEVAL